MSWINRLEHKIGHWAIPHLMRYIAAFTALCFILIQWSPDYVQTLVLDRDLVLKGEIWRLVSYLFIPRIGSIFPGWFVAAFYILYLFWVGDGLEQAMGAFRLNLYYLLGMLGTTAAALLTNSDPTGAMLSTTLFLAFARFFPESTIYVMFIVPVKILWMAWFTAALLALSFLVSPWQGKLSILAGLVNFFVFFGPDFVKWMRFRQEVSSRRTKFEKAQITADAEFAMHKCQVCGRTERTNPELEFRVSADGEEYCAAHLPSRQVQS